MKRLCTMALTAGLAVLLPITAEAAGQGNIGAVSTGTIGISVTIPASVYLRSEASPSLDMTAGTAAYDACLAGRGIDAISLAAEGSGVDGAFTLTNTADGDLPYIAAWNGRPLPPTPVELAPPGDCIALKLSIRTSGADAVEGDGIRAGVLTLIMAPE